MPVARPAKPSQKQTPRPKKRQLKPVQKAYVELGDGRIDLSLTSSDEGAETDAETVCG